jgi:hypothetical protein
MQVYKGKSYFIQLLLTFLLFIPHCKAARWQYEQIMWCNQPNNLTFRHFDKCMTVNPMSPCSEIIIQYDNCSQQVNIHNQLNTRYCTEPNQTIILQLSWIVRLIILVTWVSTPHTGLLSQYITKVLSQLSHCTKQGNSANQWAVSWKCGIIIMKNASY